MHIYHIEFLDRANVKEIWLRNQIGSSDQHSKFFIFVSGDCCEPSWQEWPQQPYHAPAHKGPEGPAQDRQENTQGGDDIQGEAYFVEVRLASNEIPIKMT